MSRKTFSLTTPLYFTNGPPHVGHAYTTIAADVIARYHRLEGLDVFFLTGTDENAGKVVEAAKEQGKTPREFVDEIAEEFKKAWKELNINYDGFIRTTDEKHWDFVRGFLQKIYDRGDIYKAKYEGLYCTGCEAFLKESDLVNGLCPDHQKPPRIYSEENYFFRLSKYRDRLIELIESDEVSVQPEIRKNEILGKLKLGLEDISISRANVTWGIPFPFDPAQRCYCWIEALQGYLSGTPEAYWPINLHLLAKDILWFHSVIFEALLLSAGYLLPKKVFAHGFFTVEGQKMSKTIGNVISPHDLVGEFGADASRYLLLSEIPFGSDGDLSLDRFRERYNSDLANGLGNLRSRIAKLCERSGLEFEHYEPEISEILSPELKEAMESFEFNRYLELVWAKISALDRLINDQKPWEMLRDDSRQSTDDRLKKILDRLVSEIREIAVLVEPFIPKAAAKIKEQFKGPKIISAAPLFPRI